MSTTEEKQKHVLLTVVVILIISFKRKDSVLSGLRHKKDLLVNQGNIKQSRR